MLSCKITSLRLTGVLAELFTYAGIANRSRVYCIVRAVTFGSEEGDGLGFRCLRLGGIEVAVSRRR